MDMETRPALQDVSTARLLEELIKREALKICQITHNVDGASMRAAKGSRTEEQFEDYMHACLYSGLTKAMAGARPEDRVTLFEKAPLPDTYAPGSSAYSLTMYAVAETVLRGALR